MSTRSLLVATYRWYKLVRGELPAMVMVLVAEGLSLVARDG